VFVQNHDQVGNRAQGERLAALVSPAGRRLAAALLLLSPYVPLLFMGEEYGETNPFLYFVSHGDPELVEAVREGRRRELESFVWSGDIPDPQAQATFAASRLDWTRAEAEGHRELLALHRDLLKLRRDEPALRPATAEAHVFCESPVPEGENGWVALELRLQGKRLLATFNLSAAPREARLPFDGTWRPRLSTDDTRYGGSGTESPRFTPADGEFVVRLPGLTAVLYEERQADA
ncbi:MAG: DUF3459 domain-containing protein, partial [Candidatus Binatia bacterium]